MPQAMLNIHFFLSKTILDAKKEAGVSLPHLFAEYNPGNHHENNVIHRQNCNGETQCHSCTWTTH